MKIAIKGRRMFMGYQIYKPYCAENSQALKGLSQSITLLFILQISVARARP
jgi:TfoX/Sxy family transcriptional regulator of competence genes